MFLSGLYNRELSNTVNVIFFKRRIKRIARINLLLLKNVLQAKRRINQIIVVTFLQSKN